MSGQESPKSEQSTRGKRVAARKTTTRRSAVVAKFTRKNAVVEAIQWRGNNDGEVIEFLGVEGTAAVYDVNIVGGRGLFIPAFQKRIAVPGDWIVTGGSIPPGAVEVRKPDDFEREYT